MKFTLTLDRKFQETRVDVTAPQLTAEIEELQNYLASKSLVPLLAYTKGNAVPLDLNQTLRFYTSDKNVCAHTIQGVLNVKLRMEIMIRKIAIGALIGFAIGCTMELLLSAFAGNSYNPGATSYLDQFDNQNIAVLIQRLIYSGLGAIQYCAAGLYKRESWPLPFASLVHALIVLTSALLAGAYLHWFPLTLPAFIGFTIVAVLIYALVWVVSLCIAVSKTRRVNAALAKAQV